MATLKEKVDFARKYWRAPGGQPFEITEDDWLYQHYWRPLHSFRIWPVDGRKVCDKCRKRIGELTEDFFAVDSTRSKRHTKSGKCKGLYCEVIQFVLINLKRQTGKTVGTSGYIGASLFKEDGHSIVFIAGSEDQSEELFQVHFRDPIVKRKALRERASVLRTSIAVPKTGSRFVFVATSLAGTTGGTNTLVIMDEARAIPAKVAAALLPTIIAQSGWQCPGGARDHTRTKGDLDSPKLKTCSTCGERLIPWTAKVMIMSSASELDGGDKDWFFELCDAYTEEPHPRAYVFRSAELVGKKTAKSTLDAIASFFGKSAALASHVEIETSNVSRRKGVPFLTQAQIGGAIDRQLYNFDGYARPCVGFLDTSQTTELTSLVIVADDAADEEPDWFRSVVVRIDLWDPKQTGGLIDDRAVLAHLQKYVPLFPLVALRVDTRLMPWAVSLVRHVKQHEPWGRIVDGVDWRDAERAAAWNLLESRIVGRTIRYPEHKTLLAELKTARRQTGANNRLDVREASRKKRHLDVAESLASCCYLIHLMQIGQLRSFDFAAFASRAGANRVLPRPRAGGFNPGGNWF